MLGLENVLENDELSLCDHIVAGVEVVAGHVGSGADLLLHDLLHFLRRKTEHLQFLLHPHLHQTPAHAHRVVHVSFGLVVVDLVNRLDQFHLKHVLLVHVILARHVTHKLIPAHTNSDIYLLSHPKL